MLYLYVAIIETRLVNCNYCLYDKIGRYTEIRVNSECLLLVICL